MQKIINVTGTLKWMEFNALFLIIPFIYSFVFPHFPLFLILGVAAGVALLILYYQGLLNKALLLKWQWSAAWRIMLRFLLVASLIAVAVWYVLPGEFLQLPRERPRLMLLIVLFYPVLSVLPQELVFRSLYYERYERLFRSTWAAVLINAIMFGLAHLLFGNWLAVLATIALSIVISIGYLRHRSLLLSTFEHALYGNFVFIIGLGEFFYKGAAG